MNFMELNEKKIKSEIKTVVEKYDPVRTIAGDCEVERIWLRRPVRITGEGGHNQTVDELLGYRILMPRHIKSDVCIHITDAIKSGEKKYREIMDTIVEKVKDTL